MSIVMLFLKEKKCFRLFLGLSWLLLLSVVLAIYRKELGLHDVVLKLPFAEQVSSDFEVSIAWTVKRETKTPDGVERDFVLVNGMYPGPSIEARVNDTVRITLHNELDESTSIHFHGLYQRGSNTMDGVPGVTQCGIPPGHSFVYEFILTQSGTFWWHSHSSTQRGDGMFGAFIVKDPENEHYIEGRDYDEEILLVIHDYYHRTAHDLYNFYMSKTSGGLEPPPDNLLINGQGIMSCSRVHNSSKDKCTDGIGIRPTFTLQRNRRYRFRLVNTSIISEIVFSLDDLVLNIVEADSIEVEPIKSKYVPVSPGQRYSIIVFTNSTKQSLFMRTRINTNCLNYHTHTLISETTSIILFEGVSSEIVPETTAWPEAVEKRDCVGLDPYLLHPLITMDAPKADITLLIWARSMQLERVHSSPFGFINRTSFRPAIGASNVQVAAGLVNISETFPQNTVTGAANTEKWGGHQLISEIPYGAVVEVIINNLDEADHPFHLHGHDFYIVHHYASRGTGFGHWRPRYVSQYNSKNPPRRDTLTIQRNGHSVIRFVADNPGIWALHCHVLWHLAAGMMMQFATGMDQFNASSITPAMLDHCRYERELGSELVVPLPGDKLRSKSDRI
ncbi:Cupredoxin [Dipodascopsis uninucleata]